MFEEAAQGFLNLRGDAVEVRKGVAEALGVDLPVTPCTFVRTGDVAVYWLGPDEWLAAVPNGEQAQLATRLRGSLDGHFSIADVSGGQTLLELGAGAGEILKQSSPCDFHPRAFPPGRCRQTMFAKTHALVAANSNGTFHLIVRTSYADYVRDWIKRCLPT